MPHTRKQKGGVRSQQTRSKSGIVRRFLKTIQTRVKSLNPKSKTKKSLGVSKKNVKEKVLNANNLLEVMTSVNGKLKGLMSSYDNIEDQGSDLMTAISKVFAKVSEGLIKLHQENKLSHLKGYSTLKKLGNPEDDAPERVDELTKYIDKVVIKKQLVPLGRLILEILRGAFHEHKAELEAATAAAMARSASVNEEMHGNNGNNGNNARSSASNHRSRASSSDREQEELGDDLEALMGALEGARI